MESEIWQNKCDELERYIVRTRALEDWNNQESQKKKTNGKVTFILYRL